MTFLQGKVTFKKPVSKMIQSMITSGIQPDPGVFTLFVAAGGLLMTVATYARIGYGESYSKAVNLSVTFVTLGKFREFLIEPIAGFLHLTDRKMKRWFANVLVYANTEKLVERRTSELRDRCFRLGQKLREYQARQNSSHASLEKLTAGLAHELNNSLNVIGGVVDPIRKDLTELKTLVPDKKEAHYLVDEMDVLLGDLSRGAERAANIISNLTKISTSVTSLSGMRHFDAFEHLMVKCQWMQLSFPHVKFGFKVRKNTRLFGDVNEILHCIHNLMINAVEATAGIAAPQVEVIIGRESHFSTIIVSDNGPGISGADRKRIFEPFYTTKKPKLHSGMGLFTVHHIVKKYGGVIEAEENLTGGTIFKIKLPGTE